MGKIFDKKRSSLVIILSLILGLSFSNYCLSQQITGKVIYREKGIISGPVVGAEIILLGQDTDVSGIITDKHGEFNMDVASGDYIGMIIKSPTIEEETIGKFFTLESGVIYDFGEISVKGKFTQQESAQTTETPSKPIKKLPKARKIPPQKPPTSYKSEILRPFKIAIGLGNPYLSLKVGKEKWCFEPRAAFGSGIKILSARVLRGFKEIENSSNINLFAGIEGGIISFDKTISGKGLLCYTFVGGEYLITDRFALILDAGPAYIDIKEKTTEIGVNGIEYVVNIGINLYLR